MNVEKMTERVGDALNAAYRGLPRTQHADGAGTPCGGLARARTRQSHGYLGEAVADPKALARRVDEAIGQLPTLIGAAPTRRKCRFRRNWREL